MRWLSIILCALVVGCTAPRISDPPTGVSLSRPGAPSLPPLPPGFEPRAIAPAMAVASVATAPTSTDTVPSESAPLTNVYVYPQEITFKPLDSQSGQRDYAFYSPTGQWSAYHFEQSDSRGEWEPVGGATFTEFRSAFNPVFGFAMIETNDSRIIRLKLTGYAIP